MSVFDTGRHEAVAAIKHSNRELWPDIDVHQFVVSKPALPMSRSGG